MQNENEELKDVDTNDVDTESSKDETNQGDAPVKSGATSRRQQNSKPSAEKSEMEIELDKIRALTAKLEKQSADFDKKSAEMDIAIKKANDSTGKKDNTKPLPLTKEAMIRYIAKLMYEKPRVYAKKKDELDAKLKAFG